MWSEIAYDVLTAEDGPQHKSIPRDHVIELVCDAGRLDEEVERAVRRARKAAADLAALEELSSYMKAQAPDLEKILRPYFPHEHYGL